MKRLITHLFGHTDWEKAGHGWRGREDTLPLSGWTRARRVVILRRRLKGDVVLSTKGDPQGTLAFIETAVATAGYEYAVPSGTQGDSWLQPIIRFSRSPHSTGIVPGLRTISTNGKTSGDGADLPPVTSSGVVSSRAWWPSSITGGISSYDLSQRINIRRHYQSIAVIAWGGHPNSTWEPNVFD